MLSDPWQRSGRQATYTSLPRGLSWIPTDSHSLRPGLFFPWIYFSLSQQKHQYSWAPTVVNYIKPLNFTSEFTWGCLGNRLYNSYTAPCGVLILHISVWQTTICEICDMYHYVKRSLPREGLTITWITQACVNEFVFLWKLIWTSSPT